MADTESARIADLGRGLVRLKREYYRRGANVTEAFAPEAGGEIVHVEWDDEVAVVTWLVPAAVTDGWQHSDGTTEPRG